LVLEDELGKSFPEDLLEPVAKGKQGADILQRVRSSSGRVSGSILWETKRTKAWSKGWLSKIKDDQRHATAEVAVIVTQTLPDGVTSFDVLDGVVVTDHAHSLPLATLLRERLFEVDRMKRSQSGRSDKETLVYTYLTSTEFRQTAQAIAEAIVHARNDIEKERATFERMWNKRQAQLEKGFKSLLAMWGRIQGHIGSLPDLTVLAALDDGGTTPSLPPGDGGQDGVEKG